MSKRKLTEVCDITTGKLDANTAVQNGKYPFSQDEKLKYDVL